MLVDELLDKYEDQLKFLGHAQGTKYRYMRVADLYLEYSKGVMSRDTVMEYVNVHSASSSTYRRWIMYVLKGLFDTASLKWPFSKRELPKLSKPSQPFFTYEAFQAFLKHAESSLLDYALLRVDAVTGARRGELSEIKMEHYTRPHIKISAEKGSLDRVRTLDKETCDVLDKYIKTRHSKEPWLFVSERGEYLPPEALSRRFRLLARKAGLKKGVGWHAVRRGVTTWLFEAGMRERELQDALGWRSAAMPARYIQLSPGAIESKVQASHPMFKK